MESAAEFGLRLAALNGSERLLILTPGRSGGAIMRELWDRFAKSTFPLDWSAVHSLLAVRFPDCPPEFLAASATRLPFRRHSFEAVLSFEALYSIRPPWTVLAEVHRVLVPGGKLILLEPARHGILSALRDKLTGPGKRVYSREEVRYRLARGDYIAEQIEEGGALKDMQYPAYCIRAIKSENAAEPVPQFMTANEMIARRRKPPVGEELP